MAGLLNVTLLRKEIVIGVTAASFHMEKVVVEEAEVAEVEEVAGEAVLEEEVVVDLGVVVVEVVVVVAFASPFKREVVREERNAGLRMKKASS